MRTTKIVFSFLLGILCCSMSKQVSAQRKMEQLDRGVLAVTTDNSVYVGWRIPATELRQVSYNIYRDGVKINSDPITGASNYRDDSGTASSHYAISAIVDGVEQAASAEVPVWAKPYLDIPMQMVNGSYLTYTLNDCTVGDLDGDGQYEILVKRLAVNKEIESTDYNLLEAYELDGTFMWQVNMGPNIYDGVEMNVLVYDFDGDGKAEVLTRTSDGMIDGTGVNIGDRDGDGKTNYRSSIASGYRSEGPDYISVFNGETGKEMAWDNYISRDPISQWGLPGHNIGQLSHRSTKCMWTVAYLDGRKPSFVIGRGIYERIKMEAWDWDGTSLHKRWAWDSSPNGVKSAYHGQGNHNLSCADVDGDGCDEIVYANDIIDNDGTGLYTTGFGHGDALHVADMDPDTPGLETWQCLENEAYWGATLRNSKDGELRIRYSSNRDCGRATAGDIDPNYPGWELWAATECPMYNVNGEVVGSNNVPMSQMIWWDGDLLREFLDHSNFDTNIGYGTPSVSKYDPNTKSVYSLLEATGMASNNWTKGNPGLQADLFGDWREEFVVRSSDNSFLRIYTTTDLTDFRLPTLMHDPQYRIAVAWQNNSYNQPPHPAIYLGAETKEAVPYPYINEKIGWVLGNDWGDGSASWVDEDGQSATYADGTNVLFDFTGDNSSPVNLTATLQPRSLTVFSHTDYIFSGSGKLSGSMELLKSGTGSLTLDVENDYTGVTKVYQGSLIVNRPLTASSVEVGIYGEAFLNATIGGSVSVLNRGQLHLGASSGLASSLSIENNLTLDEGARLHLDLSPSPASDNDQLVVEGDVAITDDCRFILNLTGDKLEAGEYVLISYKGDFSGDVSEIKLEGTQGIPCHLSLQDGKLVLQVSRSIVWAGSDSSDWDVETTYNWLQEDQSDRFLNGDYVTFNESGAGQTSVNLTSDVTIGEMLVEGANDYSFSGSGKITGWGALKKSGESTLTISTSNDFTGGVSLVGGTTEVAELSNAGEASALGAASGEAEKMYLNDATLQLTAANSTTDRSMTIGEAGATISAAEGATITMNGAFTGAGELTLDGNFTTVLNQASSHAATTIRNGSVILANDDASMNGLGSTVTLENARLQMYRDIMSYNNVYWDIAVPAASEATIELDGRCVLYGALTGSGTLNLSTDYVRSELMGDWSAFSGSINVSTNNDGWLILGNAAGYAASSIQLNDQVFCVYRGSRDATIEIGELSGSEGAILGSGGELSSTTSWKVGVLGTSTTFAGTINNNQFKGSGAQAAIIKTGAGSWTLTNANSYTGGTTVENGTLVLNNQTGSATGNGTVLVQSGAILAGLGATDGAVTIASGASLSPGSAAQIGNLTVNNSLTFESGSYYLVETDASDQSCDKTTVSGTVTLAGTLDLSLLGGTYQAGQSFQVFDAEAIQGSFSSVEPASPGAGLEWDLSELTTNGIVKISSVATAIDDLNDSPGIRVYPNPTTDLLKVDLPQQRSASTITIENLNGARVLEQSTNGNKSVTLSLWHLPKGIYILRVGNEVNPYRKKIIIQ